MVYRFVRSPEELECYDIFDENDVLIDCAAYKFEAEALVKILNENNHDCFKHAVHKTDDEGILGDYYECGKCGEFLQVG